MSDMGLTMGEALLHASKADEIPEDVVDAPEDATKDSGSRPGSGKSDKGRPGSGKGKKPSTPSKEKRPSKAPKPAEKTPSSSTLGLDGAAMPAVQLKARVKYCPVLFGLPTFRLKP